MFVIFLFIHYTVAVFSVVEKGRDVKFCMHIGLLPGQIFSPFGELWLAGSYVGGGITSRMTVSARSCASAWHGQSELGAAASRKAVWWDLRLASLLTHLFSFLP